MEKISKYIRNGDKKLFHIINNKIKCTVLDIVMPYITKLGGAIFVTSIPLVMIFFGDNTIKFIGKEVFIALFISHLMVQILKRTMKRERPFNILDEINTFKNNLKDYSFPSGHTTAVFSIITSLSLNLPQLKIALIFIAVTISISRVYIGVHYPSDILIGSVLGYYTSFLLHAHLFI